MKSFLLLIILVSLSISAHGALNKWVDAEGKIHYSDDLPPSNVKSQTLAIPSALSGVSTQKTIAEREAERKKALKTKEESAQKAAQQQESELTKQRNCEGAKANLRTLESNLPVQSINEKGEKSLMDSNARQQSIEEARKQISVNCN